MHRTILKINVRKYVALRPVSLLRTERKGLVFFYRNKIFWKSQERLMRKRVVYSYLFFL